MAEKSTGHVDTSHFPDALKSIEKMAKEMESCVSQLNKYKETLMNNWVGKGRNQFEKSYRIIRRKLEDGKDVTWDMYEKLIDAQTELIQADINAARELHK